ncbi:hypothetical protein BVG16_25385 [Paenibacillus selenitireducens]|uniref:Uncharacterized protein n=1 Tax=Paenibacillus selenitireducens TaxID=1324314 RepID=A0A1T2X2Z1_9BACL|nr:hypothetical protein BVG16_25385 [Paenibacillus selenitireducens]
MSREIRELRGGATQSNVSLNSSGSGTVEEAVSTSYRTAFITRLRFILVNGCAGSRYFGGNSMEWVGLTPCQREWYRDGLGLSSLD